MKYEAKIQSSLYLFAIMDFDVGMHVRLYGKIEITQDRDIYVIVSSAAPVVPALVSTQDETTVIEAPFGMTGVKLNNFEVKSHLYQNDRGIKADTQIRAVARFQNQSLSQFKLDGLILFEEGVPRLIKVALSPDPALTLTQFVTNVLGGSWEWADGITDNFAFKSGSLYFLNPPKNENPHQGSTDTDPYTFVDPDDPTVKYEPGYGAKAVVTIFDDYDFLVGVQVNGNAINLETRSLQNIDFDFIVLENADLRISTVANDTYIRIDTDIVILNKRVLSISACYKAEQKSFIGSTSVHLGSIPTGNGSAGKDVTLDVEFAWTRGGASSGFRITKLDGLPTNSLSGFDSYLKVLNSGEGQCREIMSDWIDGLTDTKISPALNGTPKKNSDGKMELPLKLTYTINARDPVSAKDLQLDSNVIDFVVKFDIPESLEDLPKSLWETLVDNSEEVIGQMLSQESTYKAIAEFAALKGFGSAGASFICRAIKQGLKKLAEDLAKAFENLVTKTLAEAAELAAALAAAALIGIAGLITVLASVFDEVKDWLTGEDKAKKKDAEEKLEVARNKIQDVIDIVKSKIVAVENLIKVQELIVKIPGINQYEASWTMNKSVFNQLDGGAVLTYEFDFLADVVGKPASIWKDTKTKVFPGNQTNMTIELDSLSNFEHYQMNARIISSVKGLTFIYPKTLDELDSAIQNLKQLGGKAEGYADDLAKEIEIMKNYNKNGIRSSETLAEVAIPTYLTIGQSKIGQNTRIQ